MENFIFCTVFFLLIVDTTFKEFDENYYFHYLSGIDKGICLDVEPIRKWTMFFLRGSSLHAHESIVFQPWILGDKEEKFFYPLQLFTTVEKRFNQHNKPYMFISRLDTKYHSHLEQIAEIAISVQQLYDYLTEIFLGLQKNGQAGNCVEFVSFVAKILPFDRRCDIWLHAEDTSYLRLRERYRLLLREKIAKAVTKTQAENPLSIVGRPVYKLRDRMAHVFTNIQGKYNAMTPIHTMFIMVMFNFETIGEIIFPIVTLFSVSLLYYNVTSCYQKRKLESSSTALSMEWNFAPKMRILLSATHALSILHMVYEVLNSINCLQAMLITQLMWLNFLFLDKELKMKAANATIRFGILKKTRHTCLFRDNIQQNITRLLLLSTFLFPSKITLPLLIFLQIAVLVKCSLACKINGSTWLKVQHFTGIENPLFNFCYMTFIVTIAACILYNERIVTVQCLTSKYHAFYLLIYFSLSIIMHYKTLQKKSYYATANDGCLGANLYEMQRVPAWYFRLLILSNFDKELLISFISILTILIMTIDCMSSLFILNVTLFTAYFIAGLTCNVKFLWN